MLHHTTLRHHRFLLVLIPVLSAGASVAAEPRTWVDKSGLFSTDAELIGVTLELKTSTGRTVRVSADRLRDEDKKFVANWLTAEPEPVDPQAASTTPTDDDQKSLLAADEELVEEAPVEFWGDMDEAGRQEAMKRLPAKELHLFRIRDQHLVQLQRLKKLNGLQSLTIAFSRVTNEGLTHLEPLKDLQSLAIDSQQITDEGLASLVKLPKLETLRLIGTRVTPAAVEQFRRLKPKCSVTSY